MRKVTVAFLALGCLALGIGSFVAPIAGLPDSATVYAQSPLHPCTQGCEITGDKPQADHYAFCHVDRGGEGHVICPDSSSIAKHLQNHQPDGDFCINSAADLEACEGKK